MKFLVKYRTLMGFDELGTWGRDPELQEMIFISSLVSAGHRGRCMSHIPSLRSGT